MYSRKITILSILSAVTLSICTCAPAVSAAGSETTVLENIAENGIFNGTDLFTSRDLKQSADTGDAVVCTVSDGNDISISEEGVYILSGTAANATVYVEADSQAKIQLVLDDLHITNDSYPCIYITEADKVFLTTTGDSSLSVTGAFISEGSKKTDGAVFSRTDLTLNGTAALTVSSSGSGIVCKDDLKITGGTYEITSGTKAIEANDSIRIADGTFLLNAGTDGLHTENDQDDTLGYIYICGGDLTINADDDAIHAASVIQIDSGSFQITAAEGMESTYIQINGGSICINGKDDGINAGKKSKAYYPTIEINDGDLTIDMGLGDTDGIDSNGDLIINGGQIEVNSLNPFDYDGTGQYNGGTIIANGKQLDKLPVS